MLAWTIVAALFAEATAFADARFEVDASSPGCTLPNVQKMLVKWQLKGDDFAAVRRNAEFDVLEFAESEGIRIFRIAAASSRKHKRANTNHADRGL